MNFGTFIVLSIGIDRLFSITCPVMPTFCLIASAYHDSVKDKWANITLLVNVLVILTYSAAWISTKFKSTKFERRIFRSLLVITSLVLFGWFTASLIFSLTIQLGWKAEKIVKTMMFAGTACINTSIALNYPVYAREYRVAFVEQLRILTCRYRSSRTRPGISTIQVDGSNTSAHSTNRRNYEINSNVK
ncbi:7 transmembrane receptor [Aphelenchoides bicaudatus]|nr:7 transmembrane receptor [Aphelenchoides bicaudatus]